MEDNNNTVLTDVIQENAENMSIPPKVEEVEQDTEEVTEEQVQPFKTFATEEEYKQWQEEEKVFLK